MVKLINPTNKEMITCTGFFANPVKNPRKIYSFETMWNHQLFDDFPEAISFEDIRKDKYNQYWKVFKLSNGWKVKR